MNRRSFISSAFAFGSVTGCGVLTPQHTVRFEMEMSANVAGSSYTGKSVSEITWTSAGPLAGFDAATDKWQAHRRGQALILDLGPHGLIFGLWEHVPHVPHEFIASYDEVFSVLPKSDITANKMQSGEIFEELKSAKGQAFLKAKEIPVLLRFRNIHDITSAEIVEPEDFAKVFGEQSNFHHVALSVTDAPVTQGIKTYLPAWDKIGSFRYPAVVDQSNVYMALKRSNFVVGGDVS